MHAPWCVAVCPAEFGTRSTSTGQRRRRVGILERLRHGIYAFTAHLSGLDEVTRLDRRAGRRETGVVHHVGDLGDDDIEIVDGRPVVRTARAVFEAASISTTESAMVTASSALHQGLASKAELMQVAAELQRWQGARHAGLARGLDARRSRSTPDRILADLERSRRLFKRARTYFPLS